MTEVYVHAAVRTPMGGMQGALSPLTAPELGAAAIAEALSRAGLDGAQVDEAGWNFVAADNWYGTVPATTVYYPDGMKREGRQLALDLGVARVQPADTQSDMSSTNLTLILTGELD